MYIAASDVPLRRSGPGAVLALGTAAAAAAATYLYDAGNDSRLLSDTSTAAENSINN